MDIIDIMEDSEQFVYGKRFVFYNENEPQTCHVTLDIKNGGYDLKIESNGMEVPRNLKVFGTETDFSRFVNIHNKHIENIEAFTLYYNIQTVFKIALHNCTVKNYDDKKYVMINSMPV